MAKKKKTLFIDPDKGYPVLNLPDPTWQDDDWLLASRLQKVVLTGTPEESAAAKARLREMEETELERPEGL